MSNCSIPETCGAWNGNEPLVKTIPLLLNNTVLQAISREFLTRTMAGTGLNGVRLAVTGGDFEYRFE